MRRLAELKTEAKRPESAVASYYEPAICRVLHAPPNVFADTDPDLYVVKRITPDSELTKSSLRARLNRAGVSLGSKELGETELDLLDFSICERPNSVLCLVGVVGAGKTSTIQFVFGHLASSAEGLEGLAPMVFDCNLLSDSAEIQADLLRAVKVWWARADWLRQRLQKRCSVAYTILSRGLKEEIVDEKRASTILRRFVRAVADGRSSGLRPVLVLDNTDLLRGRARSAAREFARSVNATYGIPCIVTLRPDTFRSIDHVAGLPEAFVGYYLPLSRPDLGQVIRQRFKRLEKQILKELRDGLAVAKLEMEDGTQAIVDEQLVKQLFERVGGIVGQSANQDFLWELANGSLRLVLVLVDRLLSYDESLITRFADDDLAIGRRSEPLPFETVIKSQMLHDAPLYGRGEVEKGAIPNIFRHLRSRDVPTPTKYWILCYMDGAGGAIRRSELIQLLRDMRLPEKTADKLADSLVNEKFLEEVEYDKDSQHPLHLRLAPRGRLMLDCIAGNPDYLYQVVVDCEMPSEILRLGVEADPSHYTVRTEALLHLLRDIVEQEAIIFDTLCKCRRYDALWRISYRDTLSRIVWSGLWQIAGWADNAREDPPRQSARRIRDELPDIAEILQVIEWKLKEVLNWDAVESALLLAGRAVLPDSSTVILRAEGEQQGEQVATAAPEITVTIEGAAADVHGNAIAICRINGDDLEVRELARPLVRDGEHRLSCVFPLTVTGRNPRLRSIAIRSLANGAPFLDMVCRREGRWSKAN